MNNIMNNPDALAELEPTPMKPQQMTIKQEQQMQQLHHLQQHQGFQQQTTKKVTPEKLRSVMEAANALTALCDEDEEEAAKLEQLQHQQPQQQQDNDDNDNSSKPTKRFIPEHKKPDAALTFPEKLMSLMKFADQQEDKEAYCIAWLEDGKSFVIRDPDSFTRQVLPKFFKATKFSSFTRKLYRWGFRQVNRGIGPDDPIIFGNENFRRAMPEDMSKMRSITAASTRKAEQSTVLMHHQHQPHMQQQQQQAFPMNMMGMNMNMNMNKRSFDATGGMSGGGDSKRLLLEQWMQQKNMSNQQQPNNNNNGNNFFNSGGGSGMNMNLTTALGRNPHFNPASLNTGGMKPFDMNMNSNMNLGGGMNMGSGMNMNMNMMGGGNGHNNGNQGQQMSSGNPLFNSFPMQSLNSQNDNNGGMGGGGMGGGNQQQQQGNGYANTTSTADIVNAAINALRYA